MTDYEESYKIILYGSHHVSYCRNTRSCVSRGVIGNVSGLKKR